MKSDQIVTATLNDTEDLAEKNAYPVLRYSSQCHYVYSRKNGFNLNAQKFVEQTASVCLIFKWDAS